MLVDARSPSGLLLIQTTPPATTVQYETSKTRDRKVAPSRLCTKLHANTILAKTKRELVKRATSTRDLKRRYVHAAACARRGAQVKGLRRAVTYLVNTAFGNAQTAVSDKGLGRQKKLSFGTILPTERSFCKVSALTPDHFVIKTTTFLQVHPKAMGNNNRIASILSWRRFSAARCN